MNLFKELRHLYGDSIVYVGLRTENGMEDYAVYWDTVEQFANDNKNDGDCYMTFSRFKSAAAGRKKENSSGSWCIGVDIDDAPLPDQYKPQLVWESSPNKLQGVYIFDHELSIDDIDEIARGLAKYMGYDSTTDAVHFFRIPGSVNHKYPTKPSVGEPYITDENQGISPYRVSDFAKIRVKKPKPTETSTNAHVGLDLLPLLEYIDPNDVEYGDWIKVGMALKHENYDFSVWDTWSQRDSRYKASEMQDKWDGFTVNAGLTGATIILMAKQRGWSPTKEVIQAEELKLKQDIKIEHISSIEDVQPEWLIEGLWGKGNVGFIAAAPKSYKSTFTYDMAIAVASGLDFYGHKVNKAGRVVILQLENTNFYTKVVLKRMAANLDDLPIDLITSRVTLDRIEDIVAVCPDDTVLLIIDPLYFAWGKGDLQSEDSRNKLQSLTAAVRERDIALMLVHHTKKSSEDVSSSDLYGSQFLVSWYESLLMLNRVKDNPNAVQINASFRTFSPRTYRYAVYPSGINILSDVSGGVAAFDVGDNVTPEIAARHLGLIFKDNKLITQNDQIILEYK